MREHVDHACNGERLARVDTRDAAFGDRRRNDAGMRETGRVELAGVFRCAGDLGAAINAGCSGTDVVMACSCSPNFLIGLRLWRARRRLCQRTDDGAPREIDLESIVREAFGVAQ